MKRFCLLMSIAAMDFFCFGGFFGACLADSKNIVVAVTFLVSGIILSIAGLVMSGWVRNGISKTALALALCTIVASTASAECHNRHVVHHNKAVVAFAVPVAVPVATVSPVSYANQAVPYTAPPESDEDRKLKKLVKMLAAELRGEPIAGLAIERYPLFAQNCATCHAKANADLGKPQMASLSSLVDAGNADLIDECIDDILHDKMPKDKHLAADVNGNLLKELMRAKKEIKARYKAQGEAQPQVQPMAEAEAPPPLPLGSDPEKMPGYKGKLNIKSGEWTPAPGHENDPKPSLPPDLPPVPKDVPRAVPQSEAPPKPEPPPEPRP